MLYIFEGPRNSGKTTTINTTLALLKESGRTAYTIKFQRTARPAPPVFMIDFLTRNYLALIDSRSICLLDRFHLTEFVMRTLDKKVDTHVLVTTTHMIDETLRNMGAVTFILEATAETRQARLKLRDVDHNKKEWLSYDELDTTWTYARKIFNESETRIRKIENRDDGLKLAREIVKHVDGGKLLNEKIPFLPPIIISNEVVLA
jgi:thymidylate kinase